MAMAKKLVSMKFEPTLLGRVDAKAKAAGIDRTEFFRVAAEDLLEVLDTPMKPKGSNTTPKPKRTKAHVPVVNPTSTGGQGIVITPIGPARKRKPRQPGEVRVSDAPIATWGENRPAPGAMLKQPKKGK